MLLLLITELSWWISSGPLPQLKQDWSVPAHVSQSVQFPSSVMVGLGEWSNSGGKRCILTALSEYKRPFLPPAVF